MQHVQADGDAFAQAVAVHHRALVRFAYTLCGSVTRAEDAVVEACARVWPRWRRGRIDNVLGDLRRAVANEVYGGRLHRLLERRQARPPPDAHAEGQGEGDALWAALSRLTPQLRVLVVLRMVEGLSEAEIATMLGLPARTVTSRLSRAVVVLHDNVEHDRC